MSAVDVQAPSHAPGAHVLEDGGVFFRVWAPGKNSVRVVYETSDRRGASLDLTPDATGDFTGFDPTARAGDIYRYLLDGVTALPDPASRSQPAGVLGPSQIVDEHAYVWRTPDWQRPAFRGRVIYEMHIGTFSEPGTFVGAIEHLDHLAALGVNCLELLPVADFSGDRNWGYDGVALYAPARAYGTPDELRQLVDAAHERGLAVILDVVYNHLGPVGNFLPQFSAHYFHSERDTPWGVSLNYDGPDAIMVRRHFVENAFYWLDAFRFDGLRLDATHAIHDRRHPHLAAEIAVGAHARGAFVVAEDERNDATVITRFDRGGWGLDGVWADDFHHTVRVALTGQRESYFEGFDGTAAEWAETLENGWLFRGRVPRGQTEPRGTECRNLPVSRFIHCISNHDQVGNRAFGERLNHSVSPAAYRALTVLICLTPYTPMLFMGQEWAATTPFLYFVDHEPSLANLVARSRRKEFAEAGAITNPDDPAIPDPHLLRTFADSKLRWQETPTEPHAAVLRLYQACLALRKREPIFQNPERSKWSVTALGDYILGLRWRDAGGDWLLVMSLRDGAELDATANAVTRPTDGQRWQRVIDSEAAEFGGEGGRPDAVADGRIHLRAEHTVLYRGGSGG